jgi:hypothetical protein
VAHCGAPHAEAPQVSSATDAPLQMSAMVTGALTVATTSY